MRSIICSISIFAVIIVFLFNMKSINAQNNRSCPEGTMLYNNKCWLKGRGAGPMSFAEAEAFCKERGMEIPELTIFQEACNAKRDLCDNPRMRFFVKEGGTLGFNTNVSYRHLHYVRCCGDPGKTLEQKINETICHGDTLPANNICWGVSPPNWLDFSHVTTWEKSLAECKKKGGRLPTLEEAVALDKSGDGYNNVTQIADGDEVRESLAGDWIWTFKTADNKNAYKVSYIPGFFTPHEYYKPKIIVTTMNKSDWSRAVCVFKAIKKAIVNDMDLKDTSKE